MKKVMIGLVICLPIASVVFCITLFLLASDGATDLLPEPENAMSKTSWNQEHE